jgi:hypothetical protein
MSTGWSLICRVGMEWVRCRIEAQDTRCKCPVSLPSHNSSAFVYRRHLSHLGDADPAHQLNSNFGGCLIYVYLYSYICFAHENSSSRNALFPSELSSSGISVPSFARFDK